MGLRKRGISRKKMSTDEVEPAFVMLHPPELGGRDGEWRGDNQKKNKELQRASGLNHLVVAENLRENR